MTNIWIYLLLIMLVVVYFTLLVECNRVVLFFIYSEIVWMFVFSVNLLMAVYTFDPVFILISFVSLLIASLEIVFLGLILSFKIK